MKNCNIFLIFAQNIDCGYSEAVLTSTHNLCFGAKIRKKYTPVNQFYYIIKVGCKGYESHGHVFLMIIASCVFLYILLLLQTDY